MPPLISDACRLPRLLDVSLRVSLYSQPDNLELSSGQEAGHASYGNPVKLFDLFAETVPGHDVWARLLADVLFAGSVGPPVSLAFGVPTIVLHHAEAFDLFRRKRERGGIPIRPGDDAATHFRQLHSDVAGLIAVGLFEGFGQVFPRHERGVRLDRIALLLAGLNVLFVCGLGEYLVGSSQQQVRVIRLL